VQKGGVRGRNPSCHFARVSTDELKEEGKTKGQLRKKRAIIEALGYRALKVAGKAKGRGGGEGQKKKSSLGKSKEPFFRIG